MSMHSLIRVLSRVCMRLAGACSRLAEMRGRLAMDGRSGLAG